MHAVRYKQAFDRYIQEKGYTDIKTLVAFSGSVEDPKVPGKNWTEVGMNGGIKESELPEHFDTHEYQVLLVAARCTWKRKWSCSTTGCKRSAKGRSI